MAALFFRPADVEDDEQIGIVVLGTNGLSLELENKIKVRTFINTIDKNFVLWKLG